MYIHMYIYIYTCVCKYVHIYIYVYIYICIYTYTESDTRILSHSKTTMSYPTYGGSRKFRPSDRKKKIINWKISTVVIHMNHSHSHE